MSLEIEKYADELRSLRTTVKIKQDEIERLMKETEEFYRANTKLRRRVGETEGVWLGRLRKAEEMHKLKTASLERHNEALGDLIVRSAAVHLNPSIIIKTNEPELKALRQQVADMKTDMRKAADTLVRFI